MIFDYANPFGKVFLILMITPLHLENLWDTLNLLDTSHRHRVWGLDLAILILGDSGVGIVNIKD